MAAWTAMVLEGIWLEFGFILKTELTEFAIGLNMGYETKRGVMNNSRVVNLNNKEKEVVIY